MKPSNVSRIRPQHVMIFGDPKSGKSSLASTLLKQGFNLTWVSMDNGHNVIFKLGLSDDYLDEHLNLIILPDTKEQPVAITTCLKIVTGAETKICDKHGRTNCPQCSGKADATFSLVHCNAFGPKDIIVYDHIGQLANSALTWVMLKDKKGDEDKSEWEHYRIQGSLMDRFLTNIQQAPYNVICITHTAETEMEDGSKKLVPLVGTVPFSRNVGKYFDHIIYCHVMNGSHRFGSSTTYQNKTVTGSREDVVIEKDKENSLVPFFNGSIPAPAKAGSIAAAKVLTLSASEKKVVETVVEPTEEEVEKEIAEVVEQYTNTDPPPTTTPNPTVDRQALLARLASMKRK